MPRLIFLNRYFHPDQSATSQLLSDLAFDLGERGYDVHVVTSQQRYDDAKARLPAREAFGGVQIHRVRTTRFGRRALIGRGFDYLSFYLAAWSSVLALARRGDVVIAKTDPPLLSIPASIAARQRGAKLVNWLQDIYPETAMRLGVPLSRGALGRALAELRDRSLSGAAANVVPGEMMADRLRVRGLPADCVRVIHNWTDDERISPLRRTDNPLRESWGLRDKFVVGYSGNLGRAHDFETALGAAERLRENPRIVFLFIGNGGLQPKLAAEVTARGLQETVRFFPHQDRAALKFSLGVPDVHWLSLKPDVEGFVFPSKLYGIAAAGRPVIAVVENGEIAGVVNRHQCGFAIAPGDGDALAQSISKLAADPELCAAMGQRARQMLDAEFSRRRALEAWRGLLDRCASP